MVIGVGVFILPLFLLLFSLVTMSLAHLYIVIGNKRRCWLLSFIFRGII